MKNDIPHCGIDFDEEDTGMPVVAFILLMLGQGIVWGCIGFVLGWALA